MTRSIILVLILATPFLAFLPVNAQSTPSPTVTSDGSLRITIVSITKHPAWISKDKTEDGEQIVLKPKPPNELVLVKVRITVLKPVDGLLITDVALSDKAQKKYYAAFMPISSAKRPRGFTVINEYPFSVPIAASLTTFNLSGLTFEVEKYLGATPK